MKAKYKILTADYKVRYTGTSFGSWLTLEQAKRLVNTNKGEMIYEYDIYRNVRLWEVL